MLKEYRVLWAECPTAYNRQRVLFVEAENEADARAIAKNHIERTTGIGWLKIESVTEAQPVPKGRVIGGDQ
ncbi:MAG: hypothetical protein NXI32_04860 [bacterium]|nr:hypothetical protein [bacterium]